MAGNGASGISVVDLPRIDLLLNVFNEFTDDVLIYSAALGNENMAGSDFLSGDTLFDILHIKCFRVTAVFLVYSELFVFHFKPRLKPQDISCHCSNT